MKPSVPVTSKVPDKFRDLLELPFAVLATNGMRGYPQLSEVAIVYDHEDDRVKISLNDSRQKMKNMRRDPHATLFINDPASPFRTLEIRADVEIIADEEFAFAAHAGAAMSKKLGLPPEETVDFHIHDLPEETRSIVVLHPKRILGAQLAMDGEGNVLPVPPDASRDFATS